MKKRGGDAEGLIATLMIASGVGLFGYIILSIKLGIAFAIPVGIIGAIATAVALQGPLGKAIARRLGGGSSIEADETTGALLGEMDELRHRLAELEERVDFSERLLARQPEPGRLAEESER
jgi:hypothetical protein